MSNTVTNIGRVSGRRNPQPVAVVTVEVNGLSLDMLPGEDPAAIIAQIEAIIAENDAKPWPGARAGRRLDAGRIITINS